jgi:hypothetical protein
MSDGPNNQLNDFCLDKINLGVCTKGEDCDACNNLDTKFEKVKIEEVHFNVNAKVYVPKSRRQENKISEADSKLNLNLEAPEYVPKLYQADEEEECEENEDEELDQIMKDIIDNDVMEEIEQDEESDEDKWLPKYKDCECCKGFVYKCTGTACSNMNVCYCKMKDECDDEDL